MPQLRSFIWTMIFWAMIIHCWQKKCYTLDTVIPMKKRSAEWFVACWNITMENVPNVFWCWLISTSSSFRKHMNWAWSATTTRQKKVQIRLNMHWLRCAKCICCANMCLNWSESTHWISMRKHSVMILCYGRLYADNQIQVYTIVQALPHCAALHESHEVQNAIANIEPFMPTFTQTVMWVSFNKAKCCCVCWIFASFRFPVTIRRISKRW